jgi:flagellar motor switch/type III secretory pathway protein FliN
LKGHEGQFASLKVRVEFSAGEVEMTAGEVEHLAPGVVIPTNLREQDFLDIRVNGKSIGSGELVQAGDRLAVRVTRLHARD